MDMTRFVPGSEKKEINKSNCFFRFFPLPVTVIFFFVTLMSSSRKEAIERVLRESIERIKSAANSYGMEITWEYEDYPYFVGFYHDELDDIMTPILSEVNTRLGLKGDKVLEAMFHSIHGDDRISCDVYIIRHKFTDILRKEKENSRILKPQRIVHPE